jgi:hypothetical protein
MLPMELLLSLFLVFVGLQEPTSQNAFFIPVPSAFAPVAKFGCPDPGTVFTYDVMAWNTKRPNRIVAIEQDELSCWVRSDAWGKYEWFGGLGARLGDEDLAEKKLITDLWPLRVGNKAKASSYNLPSRFGEVIYTVDAYGLAVVPAGAFWAYKIRKDYYWQNRLISTTTLWWSRSLKYLILQWPEKPGEVSRAGGYNWGLLAVSSQETEADLTKSSDTAD